MGIQPDAIAFNLNSGYSYDVKVLVTKSPSGTVLVIPTPDNNADYSHITNFMKNCDVPEETIAEYWVTVATTIEKHMSQNRNTWVSTHGLGVPWLHMRISPIPRYYISDYGN